MGKKLAAVLLSVLLVLSLSACKSNTQDTSATDTNSGVVSENETESSSSASEETTQAENEQTQAAETTTQQEETTTAAANQTTTTTASRQATTTTTQQTTTTTTTTKPNTTKPNYNVNSSNSEVKAVYNLVNQERSNNGMSKLSYRNDLQSAADTRAKEIASDKKYFSHTRPNGQSGLTAISDAGVSYNCRGENIGQTNGTTADMMNWWMNSSSHKGNILSKDFTGIAIGCYEQNGVKYYVQLFIG